MMHKKRASYHADSGYLSTQVHSFRLQSTQFDKKSYLTYLKGYMKSVKKYLEANNPDRVEAFEKGAQTFAKKGELHALSSPACMPGQELTPLQTLRRSRRELQGLRVLHWRVDGPRRYGPPPQLPRGRRHSLPHHLEGRSEGGQDLKASRQEATGATLFVLDEPAMSLFGLLGIYVFCCN